MGNFYDLPARTGNSPHTKSGIPPPPTLKKSGSDAPSHRLHDPMSLELHMADERVRAEGLSPAERAWRVQWLKDQHLHADEPIHVDAVHRQLNPIRLLYRWPWDKLYVHFLRPTFGPYYGTHIRAQVPKFMMGLLGLQLVYYYWKYEAKDWQRFRGIYSYPIFMVLDKRQEIEQRHPGILAAGLADPSRYRYYEPSFEKRTAIRDIGETERPW